MNKLILLGMAATLGAAKLAFFPANPPVDLQPTSPGTAQTGHLNISGTANVGMLKSAGTVFGASTAPTGFAYGGFFTAASNQGRGFYGFASSPTGLTYGGFFQNASESGRAVYGLATSTAGFNYGGYFQSASTTGRGLIGVAAATSGVNYGVYGTSASPNGFSIFGDGPMGTTGPLKIGPRQSPIGVNEALSVSSNSNSWTGAYVSTGSGGKPYYGYDNVTHRAYTHLDSAGDFILHMDTKDILKVKPDGQIVSGTSTVPSTSSHVQIYRNDFGTEGALYVQNGKTTETNIGRIAIQADAGGDGTAYGVIGNAIGGGSSTPFSYGVAGTARGLGQNFAVYGQARNGTIDYSGYFPGLLYGGSTSAGVKAFMIDHPLDPANKVLMHSSVESNERKNMYDGLVRTDGRGYATVSMPSWFEALNEDFRYQLTVVEEADSSTFVLAKVVKKLRDGKFTIRTSAPNVEVSWQITGRRHDPTSEYFPLQVERMKTKAERGRYFVPEAYGMSPELEFGRLPQANDTTRRHASEPPAQKK